MAHTAQLEASVSSNIAAGDTEIIALDGEFDLSNSAHFERQLSAAFGAEPTNVVVDLRGVRCLDSSVLLVLRRGLTRAKERGTGFALIRPNPFVWRVFVLTGLSDRFLTYSSLHEALAEG
jgi:anti-anti-sigma factor